MFADFNSTEIQTVHSTEGPHEISPAPRYTVLSLLYHRVNLYIHNTIQKIFIPFS